MESASLAHELAAFGVSVKPVEVGYGPSTGFSQKTELRVEDLIPEAYAQFAVPHLEAFAYPGLVTREVDVDEPVFQAANDRTGRRRFPAGPMPQRWPRRPEFGARSPTSNTIVVATTLARVGISPINVWSAPSSGRRCSAV